MMNSRNAPLSPVSVGGGSEWSVSKYNDEASPFQPGRGQFISPPNSGGPNGNNMNGFPPGPRSLGGPSPPPSVGRQSNGPSLYARSESGRSPRDDGNWEATLGEHYLTFKRFLSNPGRAGKPPQPPNKARDKLLRLTLGQFLELSTDVFDELRRRQDISAGRPAPEKLQEEEQFHEKRNEARGKLKYLSQPRFRDLATDVFLELERRFPRFIAGDIPRSNSPSSIRRPSRSNTGTPVNGNGITAGGFPPRGASRMRRPSDASSIRSGAPPVGGTGVNGNYSVGPSSPNIPQATYDRPLPKQLGSNTIVPNKSTMVEEDDEPGADYDDAEPPFGLERVATNRDMENRRSGVTERSAVASETDKKLLDDYQMQVQELREKLDAMEDAMKRKDDEMNNILESERSKSTAANLEKKEWTDVRLGLENKLAEAQDLNDSLKEQLNRMKDGHEAEMRDLRQQLEDARQSSSRNVGSAGADRELQAENEELRIELQEQQRITEEVRREAQESLREMKLLAQESGGNYEKQIEMERTIERLEHEVRDWRNRYARAKTQLRNMRASSLGLSIEHDISQYIKDKGFAQENGLVKDVHVTKFQIAIDEFLRGARVDSPEKVTDTMKAVVVSVRRITKDIDESASKNDELAQQRAKLKARVSSTANNLITASKNYAGSAGISPVSILDAAASHLVTSVVDLLRVAKIRPTPAGELEDDDDGTVTPVDSTGFFSPRSTVQTDTAPTTTTSAPAPPPPFQGLQGYRASIESSAYSPVNSPRESVDPYQNRQPVPKGGAGTNGGYMGMQTSLPDAFNPAPIEELSSYLDTLKDAVQGLVLSVRDQNAPITMITDDINAIADIVERALQTLAQSANGSEKGLRNLEQSRQRLLEAGDSGQDLAEQGRTTDDREWGMWKQTLPPIAFEIVREMKDVLQRMDRSNDYS